MAAILQGGSLGFDLKVVLFFFFLKSNYINKAALMLEGDEAALEPVGSRE